MAIEVVLPRLNSYVKSSFLIFPQCAFAA